MKRRTLLRGLSAAGAFAVTGCLSDGSGGEPTETDTPEPTSEPTDSAEPADTQHDAPDDTVTEPGDGSDTPSDAPTDTPSGTPASDPSTTPSGVADESLTVLDSGCGSQTDAAEVVFDGDAGTVTVTGTIWGNDACYTAVLSDVRVDGDSLTVVVAAESDAGTDEACAECITEIGYEATITVDDALPGEVTVVHRHGGEDTRVTSTER
ncbi:hypothetical protein [Halosimplex salinum]|uniref:hypothetical protein n=1 Tax=Halosimplex salinum TaxID=1710538 RepID=UPI000F45F811|nr:hypothetical protein [Halosimplex salinum]